MTRYFPNSLHIAFHGIIDPPQQGYDHRLSCSSERLQRIILALRQAGYRLVTCSEYAGAYQSGEKLATVSFDDCYLNIEKAIQTLRALGVVGTLFPIVCTLQGKLPPNRRLTLAIEQTGPTAVQSWLMRYFDETPYAQLIGNPEWPAPGPFQNDQGVIKQLKTVWNCLIPVEKLLVASNHLAAEFLVGINEPELCRQTFLGLDELKLASSMGMEIGSHTVNHVLLENQSPINCHREVKESVETLAVMLDQEVTSLGLPYGGDVVGRHVLDAAQSNNVSLCNYREWHLPEKPLTDNSCTIIDRLDHNLANQVLPI
ncbi:MAG: polysaccharide deacetylase family protein [Candidatus Buchananbacteria bacterium]|nr:polysaccharide deacetylase family protein [Candidatus Buchananbacteria bacterium]